MKISARNTFEGKISRIDKGAVNGNVELTLGDNLHLVANITNDAIDELQLTKGQLATAIIKSNFILLTPEANIKISAANTISGIIKDIKTGAVNNEVKLGLDHGHVLTIIITRHSCETLKMNVGQPYTAIIKESDILIAID